jgi:hypothetical protein
MRDLADQATRQALLPAALLRPSRPCGCASSALKSLHGRIANRDAERENYVMRFIPRIFSAASPLSSVLSD